MSYYWFNRENILNDAWDKYHDKEGKKRLLSITLRIEKFKEKMQEVSIETRQGKKKIKKGNIKEKDTT